MAKKSVKGVGLSTILKAVALLAGIAAFVMMFLPQVFVKVTILGGSNEKDLGMVTFFGDENGKGYVVPFIGYIMIIVGAILPVVSALIIKNKKIDALVTAVAGLLLIAGAIMVITVLKGYSETNGLQSVDLGFASAGIGMRAAPIVALICGLVAGVADIAAVIVPKIIKK